MQAFLKKQCKTCRRDWPIGTVVPSIRVFRDKEILPTIAPSGV